MKPEDKEAIEKTLEAVQQQYGNLDLHNQIQLQNSKLIDCRHEIVIGLTATIYEQDETGNTSGAKEICQKNYHIPVPANKDYHEYLSGFFGFLENCMATSVEKTDSKLDKETADG